MIVSGPEGTCRPVAPPSMPCPAKVCSLSDGSTAAPAARRGIHLPGADPHLAAAAAPDHPADGIDRRGHGRLSLESLGLPLRADPSRPLAVRHRTDLRLRGRRRSDHAQLLGVRGPARHPARRLARRRDDVQSHLPGAHRLVWLRRLPAGQAVDRPPRRGVDRGRRVRRVPVPDRPRVGPLQPGGGGAAAAVRARRRQRPAFRADAGRASGRGDDGLGGLLRRVLHDLLRAHGRPAPRPSRLAAGARSNGARSTAGAPRREHAARRRRRHHRLAPLARRDVRGRARTHAQLSNALYAHAADGDPARHEAAARLALPRASTAGGAPTVADREARGDRRRDRGARPGAGARRAVRPPAGRQFSRAGHQLAQQSRGPRPGRSVRAESRPALVRRSDDALDHEPRPARLSRVRRVVVARRPWRRADRGLAEPGGRAARMDRVHRDLRGARAGTVRADRRREHGHPRALVDPAIRAGRRAGARTGAPRRRGGARTVHHARLRAGVAALRVAAPPARLAGGGELPARHRTDARSAGSVRRRRARGLSRDQAGPRSLGPRPRAARRCAGRHVVGRRLQRGGPVPTRRSTRSRSSAGINRGCPIASGARPSKVRCSTRCTG